MRWLDPRIHAKRVSPVCLSYHSSDFQNVKSLLHGIMDQLIAGPAVLLQLLHARAIDPHEFRYLAHFQRRMSEFAFNPDYELPLFVFGDSVIPILRRQLARHGLERPACLLMDFPLQGRQQILVRFDMSPRSNPSIPETIGASVRVFARKFFPARRGQARSQRAAFWMSFSTGVLEARRSHPIEMDKVDDNACDSKRHGATCGAATASRCRLRRITS